MAAKAPGWLPSNHGIAASTAAGFLATKYGDASNGGPGRERATMENEGTPFRTIPALPCIQSPTRAPLAPSRGTAHILPVPGGRRGIGENHSP